MVRDVALVVVLVLAGVARLPDSRVPGRVPRYLLLLSQGLLPLFLRHATGLRGRPAPAAPVPRRDRSPDRPEPAPLRALLRHRLHLHSLRRRVPGLLPGWPVRRRRGERGPPHQPDAPRRLHVRLSLVAASRGRQARLLLLRSVERVATRDLEGGLDIERRPHAVGLGGPLLAGPVRRSRSTPV